MLMTVFSIIILFTNFYTIRLWNFQNICNEMVAPFLLRHPVYIEYIISIMLFFIDAHRSRVSITIIRVCLCVIL